MLCVGGVDTWDTSSIPSIFRESLFILSEMLCVGIPIKKVL
jgi:hypothetical protein